MTEPTLAPPPTRRVPVLTAREVRELYIGIAKLNTKLDYIAGLHRDVEKVEGAVAQHDTRLVKLEGSIGIVLWVINGGWALLGAIAFILAKIGVL